MISTEIRPKTLSELAAGVLKDALVVESFLKEKGMPVPTFSKDAPPFMGIPPAMGPTSAIYERLVSTSKEMYLMALGPLNQVRDLMPEDVMCWNVICRFNVCHKVPIEGSIPFEELAQSCNAPLIELRQILRHAMTNYIFCEPKPGYVAHTATSKLIREKPMIQQLLGTVTDEIFPAMASVADAMERYPGSQEPSASGWGIHNNAKLPMFEELARVHPARSTRFANAMAAMAHLGETSASMFDYPWESLGNATVVDIGGAKGPVCIALAKRYPDLKFICQDLPSTIEQGRAELPEEFKDRIEFQAHDFFAEQPVVADVYYFRLIFHDWPDKYCIQLLKSLIPALKKGAKVLIHDRHVPEPLTMTPFLERDRRNFILRMMSFFNARDRENSEWDALFKAADPRFEYKGVRLPLDIDSSRTPCLGFAEAVWTGDDAVVQPECVSTNASSIEPIQVIKIAEPVKAGEASEPTVELPSVDRTEAESNESVLATDPALSNESSDLRTPLQFLEHVEVPEASSSAVSAKENETSLAQQKIETA